MKITKKMEAEIKYAMNDYWESYLSGNLDHWASYLVNDYKNIGTTEAEIWNSKKEIYDYSISVLDQMVGFTELRNKKTEIIPYDPYIMVHEYLDIYIKVEEKWIFYSKLRLSSLIQKIENNWKILHQHGSYPDSKVMDGEFFAFDTLKSENLKLQKAVKDRTEELEKTNRELEIETSLERVRAIALSMKEPADMLEVCKVISNQLQLLGIKDIRNVQTAIFNRSNKTYINYEYYKLHDKELITEIDYTIHPKQMEWANEMLKSSDTFFATSFSRNELTEWVENQRKSSQFVDSYLQKAESLNYYYYSIGPVAIGMSTYTPLNDEDLRIFKKFKNVFELSYKRFIDIEKAEAQAREAQIEAALERVRSRSMAMQKSEELKEVIRVIYDQFIQLNINIEHTGFIVDYKIRDDMHIWLADKNGPLSEIIFPYFDSPHWNSFIDAKEKGLNFFANHLNFEEKNKFYKKLFTFIPDLPEEAKKFYFNCPGLAISTVLLENVGLYIENFSGTIYSDEENKILMRFGKVFQQTYTRFLDLQKAEAQARESEIELALERVRARTMAMQHSNELADASFLLDSQIRALGIKTRGCAFNIYGENESSEWFSSEMGTMPMYKTPRENVFLRYYEEGQKGKQMYIESFAGDVCAAHYDYLCTLPIMGESLKKFKESGGSFPTQQIDHATYFKYGYLLFITLEPVPEAHEIFKRFAKVFEQTYTRFLDLQKAEAQAREAQIEAALERVRSSAMAMHKSDEVGTVSDMLFSELNKLNFDLNGCSLVVIDEEKDKMELWRARSNIAVKPFASTSFSKSMELLKKYMPDWYPTFIKAVGQRKNYLTDELSEDRRSLFINAIAEQYQYSDTEKAQLDKNTPHKFTTHYIFFKLGYLALLSEKKLSEENLSIARRFVEVFDFAYTRFLDITKAEAQAREAQIETALERVRARTMAMQKSNELARTAAHLFEQLSSLGIRPYRCNIAIVNREFKNCKIWSTTNSGNVIPTASALPLDEYPELIEMYDGWKTQKPKYKFKLVGTERLEWTKYISKYLPFEEYKKNNMNEAELLKEAAYFTNLYFRQGFFTIHSKDELTDDQIKIIQRFAYVFEQTYTRFLDLENSEIQNKIIQAENERKTEELEEARQLQLAMLPKELPQLPNLDIAVYMKTATEVGGDYYDFNVGTDGELTAVIGDATGHGMKAGTIVTITKSLFNNLASEKNILKVFSQISQVIRDMKFRQLSMCLMMLKIIDNNLSISSAAMPPAFIYRKDENRAHEIVINGMPLGALPSFPYKIEEIILNPGDTILLMSDGYPELINDKGNMFGYEKALKLFEELAHKPSEKIIEGLKNSASEWVQNKMPDDDVTFVVIKVK